MSQFHKKREKNRLKENRDWRVRLSARRISRVKKEWKGSRCDRVIGSKNRKIIISRSEFQENYADDRTSRAERRVCHWGKRLLSAGRYPASRVCIHTRTRVRTYRSKGWLRIERTWHATTVTITSQVRKRPCRNCSTAEKKAGSRPDKSNRCSGVNLLSGANFIFTAIESFDNAITNARCSSNVWPW